MNEKGRPDSETVDLGEDRLMLAGTAARLFPVGGFSAGGIHGFRICSGCVQDLWAAPSPSQVIFEWTWGWFDPALDGAKESWTGMSKQKA